MIASRLVRRVERRTTLPPHRAAALRNDLAARLKQCLTAVPAGEGKTCRIDDLVAVGAAHLDARQIEELRAAIRLGMRPVPEDGE